MTALLLLLSIVPAMWLGQTLLLLAAGMPVRWRLSSDGAPGFVRMGGRMVTQASLAAVVLAYPLIQAAAPPDGGWSWSAACRAVLGYYGAMLPPGRPALAAVHGFAISTLFLAVLYFAWNATDGVRFSIRQRPGKLARRLAVVPLSAFAGAAIEELIFRGMLLRGLLQSLPVVAAVGLGGLLFAAAHYVRHVKRRWTFPGHVVLGLLLCLAFVWSGNLWLPLGVHAGGIFVIMGVRPLVRYEGPAWITGASVYPYAGVTGLIALMLLTTTLWAWYGGGPS